MKRNNLPHSFEYYFLIFSICFFLVASIFILLLETVVQKERYRSFVFSLNTFGYNAMTFDLLNTLNDGGVITLGGLIKYGIGNEMKSPFSDNGYCSESSFVKKKEGKYYITLNCDDYLIKDYEFNSKNDIDIYYLKDNYMDKIKTIKH